MDRWTYQLDLDADDDITVDLERRQVRVATPAGDDVLIEPRAHRADVIRRLLEMDLSVRCLRALLPEWSALIVAVADALEREQADALRN